MIAMDRGLGAEWLRLFVEVQSEQRATQLAALTMLLGIGLRLEESRRLRPGDLGAPMSLGRVK